MSSITGIVNVDNTLTGVEDLYLDELDVTNVVADAIELGGTDLQTTLTDLQNQITTGGGYFVICFEFNGNSTNAGYFSCGAGINSSGLRVALPNCKCIGYRSQCTTAVAAAGNIVFQKAGVSVTALGIAFATGDTLKEDYTRQTDFVLGDTISIRFNNTGSAMGGTLWRVNYIFQTNAVNGTDGAAGTNGQNVSFNTPTITTITPVTASSINDTITTAGGTQTHSLNFNIPRGKNSSFQVGTISSVGTASPSLNITSSTDGNGDNLYTMNFGLQQGQKGDKGDKGNKGDQGDEANSTFLAGLSATAAGVSAGLAAGSAAAAAGSATDAAFSALEASANGASAGAESGAEAAEAVLSGLETRVTTLEGEMDIQQTKTQYISQSATETSIGGAKTIINSTNGLLTPSLSVSGTLNTNNLNVTGDNYFAGDILMGDAKKLLTNIINQRQYPAAGDIELDATNLDIGSSFCDSIDLQGDAINITTNSGAGFTTFKCAIVDTDTQVLVEGSLEAKNLNILNNATINNNLLVDENITAGTDGELNEHIFYGTLFTQTIECIDNDNPLNIGGDTDELQLLSNNIAIGNLDVGIDSQIFINNKNISIGETLANTLVNIGNTDSKISCNGSTKTITMDATNINIGNPIDSILDIDGDTINIGNSHVNNVCNINPTTLNIITNGTSIEPSTLNIGGEFCSTTMEADDLLISVNDISIDGNITLGNTTNANTNVLIQNRNINIGTTQLTMTNPALNMGTTNKTYVEVNSLNCEINSTETLTLYSSNNSVLDGSVIDIGHSTSDINIQGSTIDIGTAGIANVINIGNNFSSVNINTIDTQYITIENFVNQLGF